jgi:cytochrome c biogenesis protein CcdA
MGIGFHGAFLGGVLTLLSPCSVMLLPAFFSYAFSTPRLLLARTGMFFLGLITTLVPLGVLAGTLGAFVTGHRDIVVAVAAAVVIVLGLIMVLGLPIPFLRTGAAAEGTSSLAVYALGTVYGLAGVCAGPLLGAVLTVAAVTGNALYGGVVLLFFAAGMAAPLGVLALVWGRLPFVRRLVRPREIRIGRWRGTWTGVVSGTVTTALGVLLLVTDGTASLGGLLGAADQVRLEGAARRLAGGVPDLVVVAIVVALAAAGWAVARFRRP